MNSNFPIYAFYYTFKTKGRKDSCWINFIACIKLNLLFNVTLIKVSNWNSKFKYNYIRYFFVIKDILQSILQPFLISNRTKSHGCKQCTTIGWIPPLNFNITLVKSKKFCH